MISSVLLLLSMLALALALLLVLVLMPVSVLAAVRPRVKFSMNERNYFSEEKKLTFSAKPKKFKFVKFRPIMRPAAIELGHCADGHGFESCAKVKCLAVQLAFATKLFTCTI